MGVTKAQYIDATIAFMEKSGVFNIRNEKWFDARKRFTEWWVQKQTCTFKGAARKYLTTITDVMILNYAVGLDVARDGTKSNTQDAWPCKLPIDSLPLQLVAKSPKLMSDLNKQSRWNFPNAVAG